MQRQTPELRFKALGRLERLRGLRRGRNFSHGFRDFLGGVGHGSILPGAQAWISVWTPPPKSHSNHPQMPMNTNKNELTLFMQLSVSTGLYLWLILFLSTFKNKQNTRSPQSPSIVQWQ
jgi:hypothetical protein